MTASPRSSRSSLTMTNNGPSPPRLSGSGNKFSPMSISSSGPRPSPLRTSSSGQYHPSTAPRIKRFQVCVWITLALAFIHLVSKPSIEVPPEDHQLKNSTTTKADKPKKTTTSKGKNPSSSDSKPSKAPTEKPIELANDTPRKEPIEAPSPTPKPNRKPSPSATEPIPSSSSSSSSSSTPLPTIPSVASNKATEKTSKVDEPSKIEKGRPATISEGEPSSRPTSKPPSVPTPSPPPPDPSSFSVLPLKTAKDLSDTSRRFVEKHCDMTQFKPPNADSWYPTTDENKWQQRAPYFIVSGVWNAGINDLKRTLLKYHPQIISSKIPGFFLPKQFRGYYRVSSQGSNTNNKDGDSTQKTTTESDVSNVKVLQARNKMFASVYSKASLQEPSSAQDATIGNKAKSSSSSKTAMKGNDGTATKNMKVAMDVSPGYIFYAHTSAHSILCVAPWSKIVVLLRNPVDRVYKQWLYSKSNYHLKSPLEDWLAQEMQLMHDVGLIDASLSTSSMDGSSSEKIMNDAAGQKRKVITDADGNTVTVSEREAWKKYQSVRNMPKPIGRSLYVLQIEQWIETFKEAGMNPADEMIVLLSEDIEAHPQRQYDKLIRFLGLAPVNITSPVRTQPSSSSAVEPMKDDTRKMLQTFFRPYNRRLKKLLTDNGFDGDWENLWT